MDIKLALRINGRPHIYGPDDIAKAQAVILETCRKMEMSQGAPPICPLCGEAQPQNMPDHARFLWKNPFGDVKKVA